MDDIRPIRIQREAFEQLARQGDSQYHSTEVLWGQPDEEGFYTPLVTYKVTDPPESWHPGWYLLAFLIIGFLLVAGVLIAAKGWPF